MGLLATLKQALGLQRALEVRDADVPLALTPAAKQALDRLPSGHGLHLSCHEVESGYGVQVDEGVLQGPPPPTWEGLPLTASDADAERLRGLMLDHHDGRWAMSLHLEVRARETPNPDGRQYLVDRVLVVGDPLFFGVEDLKGAPAFVGSLLTTPGVVSVLLRENSLTVVRAPDTPWSGLDHSVDQAVRSHFLLCGRALRSDAIQRLHSPLAQKILQVLESTVLPAIHKDGGDLELLGVDKGVVRVRMQGACAGCPSSSATLHHGIEATLRKAFPGEIERVEAV